MASFKGNGRGEGPKRHNGNPRRRRQGGLGMEALEQRRLLASNPTVPWHPTSGNLADAQNGPMANLGGDLVQIYQDYLNYEKGGAVGSFTTPESKRIEVVGTTVGIDIRGTGSLQTFEQALVGLGMKVTATSAKQNLVEGGIPIGALPAAAAEAQTIGGMAIYRPTYSYVGTANNEAETSLGADTAKTKYNVDGTGQKIGIISDSVSQYPMAPTGPNDTVDGLNESIATGNLPNNVQVLSDGPAGSTDEGRAMLENVHDVAPGASLAFASAEGPSLGGEAYFANSITSLQAAGANIIADDASYPTEPFFQDGIVAQAVNTVTSQGALYFGSTGNSADSGYQSPFRGINTTVNGVGTGQFMNFDPSGATQSPLLGINVYTAGTGLVFQWDQSFYAQSGTSQIQIYVLNSAGTIVTQGVNNPNATSEPIQITGGLPTGQYFVAIQVLNGTAPNHIEFQATGDGGFNVDHQYTLNGANPNAGITYPTTGGHHAAANTISVGAVPWWGTAPYNTTGTPNNEPFSSFGPVIQTLDANGNPITPQVLLKPDISAPDGGNTSFFFPGEVINTTTPPNPIQPTYPNQPSTVFPEPTTSTNLSQNLPSFFGTSAAVENLAGVAALMKQSVPTITRSELLTDLDTTATPLDGQAKGVWNPQAGYGLANANTALAAAQILKVAFISPGANQTVATPPTYLQVQFTLPVKLSSVSAANLTVVGPNGATVTVGQPVGVDSATFPTFVRFPITITPVPGVIANGTYHDRFVPGSIVGENGTPLTGTVTDQFNIQATQGPRINSASYVGRIVNITFNEAVNPATVTPSNVFLFRDGGVGNPNLGPNSVIVSQLPGAKMTYNPQTSTVTIDLTNVAQSSLPTDHYGLVVTTGVTDVVGNPLNGAFNGVFPSGSTPAASGGSTFLQDLGVITVQPPIISYLALAPATDTGIQGDSNTRITTPSVVGQITAKFPGSLAGVLVYAEFNGISHAGVPTGGLDLAVGANGRGFVGHYDVQVITNALGQFTINYPAGVTPLPNGLNTVRVVAVGQPDQPPFAGLSSSQNASFVVDTTQPYVGSPGNGVPATSIPEGANINGLTSLTLNVIDPVNPQAIGSPFAVNPKIATPALNPTIADNIQNYKLFRISGGTTIDESSFIASASFTSTSARVLSSDPYTGQVVLTINPGLPTGTYKFLALSSAYGTGLSDAAGNAFAGYPNEPGAGGSQNFQLDFNLQPTPTYITNYSAYSPDSSTPGGYQAYGARASYELPVSGLTPRAPAPPSSFSVDFSNSLNPNVDYSSLVQLVRSADSATALPDGNFGTLGTSNDGSGYTTIAGISVTLGNSVAGAVPGQFGYDNRLSIHLPAGLTLPADYYRVYLPNSGKTAITDIYGNQLDGEFLGYQNSGGKYVDQLQTGQVRGSGSSELPDLTGDGTPGGAFMTGFVVVPNGNIIYANAAAIYNPQIPADTPDGSQARPYPVLAPEAVPTVANGGDLNSPVNAGANFDPTYDRSGDGQFEPSAFFAAQQRVELNGGPVVIIAQQSVPSRDPNTGQTVQKPFVLQAPSPSGGQVATIANDASAAVPAMTTLDFQSGVILKMQNAALLVQNQGSAFQITGGPNSYQGVTITSYKDSSIGGATNGDPNSTPAPGDYGGIVFRNYSQAAIPGESSPRSTLFPGQIPITGDPLADNRLKGQFATLGDPTSQVDAISGADDIMSSISFLTERYAGGVVPLTVGAGVPYDGITLINSRPAVVNSIISSAGGAGSAGAGLSDDVDSLRADDVAQGPLIRNDQFINNGYNGIYIRAQVRSGVAQATNAEAYAVNPTTLGGEANYVLDNPYPYLLTSKLEVGQTLDITDGTQGDNTDRLYIIPGMLVKFEKGAWIEVGTYNNFAGPGTSASLNVGDSTYIKEYDANNQFGPTSPGFKANSSALAKVIFTSFNDNAATTTYTDPVTQAVTTIVQPLPVLPTSVTAPAPAQADWGGIQLDANSRDVINSAIFRYGGGMVNTAVTSIPLHALDISPGDNEGAFISITNNLFTANADVPINMTPNALLATDPSRPLNSGAPFIHGNILTGNQYNAVGVVGGTSGFNIPNLDFNSTWAGSDFTYLLRDTIVLGPGGAFAPGDGTIPAVPSSTQLQPEPTPNVTLTLQSTLAGTVLADGSVVPAPGVPLVIKLMNTPGLLPPAASDGTIPTAAAKNSYQEGAGFVVGIDNGVDPTADSLVDPGAFSQLRIVGIGANQTTGQSRVPVVITSIHDGTVGTTVNGVQMNQVITNDSTAAKAGDGGVIYFGGNMLTDYNLLDPRDGSVIDNADLKYLTRVEHQGGGLIYAFGVGGALVRSYDDLLGLPLSAAEGGPGFADQYNQAKSLTVSNSNFSSFSDLGFYAHPGYGSLLIAVNYTQTPIIARNTSFLGEPTHDFFVNDTFSNMPTAVEVLSVSAEDIAPNNGPFPAPAEAIFLNDTFYANGVGIHTIGAAASGTNFYSHVALLAMDNIFANSTTSAVINDGQNYGGLQNIGMNGPVRIIQGQLEYNLFNGNAADVTGTSPAQNSQAYTGDPAFRDPKNGNFSLLPNSAAIDRSWSEIGPTIFGDMLYPSVSFQTTNGQIDPSKPSIRNAPGVGPAAGDVNPAGGLVDPPYNSTVDIVTLPGETVAQRGFPDQWIPVLQSSGLGTGSTAANAASYFYEPLGGERDQAGNLRVPDPNTSNTGGFGSRPYFDLGAFEYIIQNPPVVESVNATNKSGAFNIYTVGGIGGTNTLPTSIQFRFNEQLNPATINGMSVILQASGGDGLFGNGNSPSDRTINLSGKLSFNSATDILTVDTSGIFTSTATANDEYRIILKGTGSSVIRDNSGLALDGTNLDSSGNQLPLPSGADKVPGSDFQVTFTIDTHPPAIVKSSFVLDPASDTSGGRDITKNNLPTFDGTITDIFPPTNPLVGQTVYIDISSQGNGVFDILNAGVGTTDANGNFKVTLTKPIPDTPNTFGTNGIQGSSGATYTDARVRIVDQAGNASNQPTDPFSEYQSEGAAAFLEVDTKSPTVKAFSPPSNTVASVNANGQVTVSVTFSQNIKTTSFNANSVIVQRTGGTGSFANPINIPIAAGSTTISYSTAPATLGQETITFALAAPLTNDQYRVVLKGTGANPVTDIAGNPLDGQGTGSGSDFTGGPFVIYNAARAHLIYVQAPGTTVGTGTQGTRENPFPTIAAGMTAALLGDDVLVLPGTYREDVTLKPGVRLLSAALTSTDTAFQSGSPYQTLIYGVPTATSGTANGNNVVTVSVSGAIPGVPTEVSGFAVLSPLLGDVNFGTIDPTDVGIRALNSDLAIDRNIVINAGIGVSVGTTGTGAPTSRIFDNIIAGNINGIGVSDNGRTTSVTGPFVIVNNTIADNTTGLYNVSSTPNVMQALVVNDIFYSNHDLTASRPGTGIASYAANTLGVGWDLFYQNGPNNLPASNASGLFGAFVPSALTTSPDVLNNLIGNPFFVQPEDPRPNGDSPAVFLNYSNFDLTSRSVAINAGNNASTVAPSSDFLYRTPVAVAGHGFPGTGPASIGAFYFNGATGPSGGSGIIFSKTTAATAASTGAGTGSTAVFPGVVSTGSVASSPIGGGIALGTRQFNVVTTSLSGNGSLHAADATGGVVTEAGPTYIDVDFSDSIKASSLSPTDLVLSGNGLNPANPAKATGLAWIDDHAVRFFLSGSYNNSGTVNVSIPQGAIADASGAALVGFNDSIQLAPTIPPSPAAPVPTTPPAAPTPAAPVVQPVAAAAPVAVVPVAHKLTAKQLKQQAAEAKAEKAAEAKAAKQAAQAKAAQAKAALKAKKAK